MLKKFLGTVIAAAMIIGSFNVHSFAAADFESCGGWYEEMYAEWAETNPTAAKVEYRVSGSGNYIELTGDDKKYLQRKKDSDSARVDILGLSKGKYDIKVTSSTGTVYEKTGVDVDEYDRSGYAHFNYKEGVGAYKDNGQLKENAIVLYVTDENKDEVTVSAKDGTTVKGIGNILNSVGAIAKETGAKTNTNQGIIKKLALEGTPLVVRIIGTVNPPEGLTAYNSADYGGTKGDNGFMARMQSGKDVTIEGVGYDAQIKKWGIHFICESSATQLGKSFEVRNIDFWGSVEDSVGMEGQQDSKKATANLNAPVERCWVHNNTFEPQELKSVYPGFTPAESDKGEGDGCCDFKRGQYFTMSYNRFINAHKTNLVGSSDTSLQYHLTFHHNYYTDCQARGPLARRADIHMYNNYYARQTDYVMNPRANAYIFSEYNYIIECKNSMTLASGGVIKSYNDTVIACSKDRDAEFVDSKTTPVASACKYAGFELDPSISYIPSGNYKVDESAVTTKANVFAYAGVMKEAPIKSTDVDTSIIESAKIPKESVSVPSKAVFNKSTANKGSGNINNVYYEASAVDDEGIKISKQGITFKLDVPSDVTLTMGNSSYYPQLYSEDGKLYITGTGTATLMPGVYFVQSDTFDPGKQVYKESKVAEIEFAPANSVEITTQTTTDSSTEVTTEEDIEETTDVDGFVNMGTYNFGRDTINEKAAEGNNDYTAYEMVFNDLTAVEDALIKLDQDSSISFATDRYCEFTVQLKNSNGIEISDVLNNKGITENGKQTDSVTAKNTATFVLAPGSYMVSGVNTSNTQVTAFIFKETTKPEILIDVDYTLDSIVASDDAAKLLIAVKDGNADANIYDLNGDNVVDNKDAQILLDYVRHNDHKIVRK